MGSYGPGISCIIQAGYRYVVSIISHFVANSKADFAFERGMWCIYGALGCEIVEGRLKDFEQGDFYYHHIQLLISWII
jgi:hypothetical protein